MASNTPSPNSELNVAGLTGVKFYNDHLFARIRKKYNVPNDVLRSENFSFSDIAKGGGKGGDPMARTKDKMYFVKEMGAGDHKSLLNILEEYVEHIDTTDSLIARFVMHFNVPKPGNPKKPGKNYIVMNSWAPVVKTADVKYLLDLKGCRDDKIMVKDGESVLGVHKRFFKLHMFCGTCCWSAERKKYFEGKKEAFAFNFNLELNPKQRDLVLKQIESDVRLFQRLGLMDYSLILTILERPTNDFPNILPFAHNQPHVVKYRGGFRAYYFGIIDFLQDWSFGKKVAHCIKATFAPKPISTIEPRAFGEQFLGHFQSHIRQGEHSALNPEPRHAENPSEDALPPSADGGAQARPRVFRTSFGMDASEPIELDGGPGNNKVLDLVMIDAV